MSHFMIDLETLGNGSTAAILSIGAVEFIPNTSQIGRKFEALIDPASCVEAGLKIDASTVMWWMEQSDAARGVFKKPKQSLKDALMGFARFLGTVGDSGSIKIWGNGATFDNVILSNAYLAINFPRPWKYYNDMCFRTMKKLYPSVHQDAIGVSHNALDDAEYQARLLMKIFVQAGLRNV